MKKNSKRLNILFSTTRTWNIWDEFIMRWIENLLEEIWINYNKILFNRNPEINWWFEFLNFLRNSFFDKYLNNIIFQLLRTYLRLWFYDNSFSYKYYHLYKDIDYIIFAGSPEWSWYRSKILFDLINKNQLKALFLFIWEAGHPWNKTKKWIVEWIKKSKLIILRNPEDFKNFKKLNPNTFQLSCPALFCEKEEKNINCINNIWITFSFPNSSKWHNINKNTFNELIKFINYLKTNYKEYKLYWIFHNIKDFYLFSQNREIKALFKDSYYSWDREDYKKFYKKFDLIISTRVHWNWISSSLWIPNIAFIHDDRWSTVLWFWSHIVKNIEEAKSIFNIIKNNIKNENKKLKDLKQYQKKKRINILYNNIN